MSLNKFHMFESTFLQTPVCMSSNKLSWEDCNKIVKGEISNLDLPIILNQSSGKKWTDVLAPSSASMYIVSNKFINLMEEKEIVGWSKYPIKIFDKKGNEVFGYNGFSVTGRCGKVDLSKSKIVKKRLMSTSPLSEYYRGLHIDLETWDGSDFFIPEDSLHIIITDRVKHILENNNISNLDLKNLTDLEILKV